MMLNSRRDVLGWTAAASASAMVGASAAGRRLEASPTPGEQIGPFYPVVAPHESRADLTRAAGSDLVATGDRIALVTTIRSPGGAPVVGAMVLVWHASAAGVYGHPRDFVALPPDPGFRGHALLRTDRQGQVRIETVRPGSYPDMPGTMRTPHVHFEIIGESSRLITQMYFPDEPLNATDRLLNAMRPMGKDPRALIAHRAGVDPAALVWEVVLPAA